MNKAKIARELVKIAKDLTSSFANEPLKKEWKAFINTLKECDKHIDKIKKEANISIKGNMVDRKLQKTLEEFYKVFKMAEEVESDIYDFQGDGDLD